MARQKYDGEDWLIFPLSDEQLETAIEEYKKDYYADEFARPTPEHFLARYGATLEDARNVFRSVKENPHSTYKKRALQLRAFFGWIRGEWLSSSAGQNASSMVKYVLSQDWGDGQIYTDNPQPQQQTLQITFGNGDKRGVEAGK